MMRSVPFLLLLCHFTFVSVSTTPLPKLHKVSLLRYASSENITRSSFLIGKEKQTGYQRGSGIYMHPLFYFSSI